MYLDEYQKITIDNFMGLWNRGSLDDVPQDHASDISNMAFARKRETLTRPSASVSHTLPNPGFIVRQFDAAFFNESLIPLALDGLGNIWRLDNYTILLSLPDMIDFDALNMNNHVYIAPMISGGATDFTTDFLYVWTSPAVPIRPAAGLRPPPVGAAFATLPGTGNTGPGWYGVAVSYVYDTGYVTPPSQVQATYMPGNTEMEIDGIPGHLPNLPTGVIGYLIFVTKAQATEADAERAALYELMTSYDVSETGNILVVNFFDTDLVILATNDPANGNLLNSMPILPTGGGYGSVALIKYHGRMIIIGPDLTFDPNTAQATTVYDGRIYISHAGAPENFDILTGYLIIQAEFDGNIPRTGFELFGVLYVCKAVGTFAAQDNGSEPNDPTNPWVVNLIDGGIGAYHHAIGTISGSQPGLSFNSTAFLANRNGLFLFNGNVLRPELTWKIRAVWAQMTINVEYQIRVTVDIFNDIFYVMIPTNDPTLGPLVILVGDYSLGLDSNNIRWSIYQFPWPVYDIIMASWPDPTGTSFYYLRLGSQNAIYKLDGANTWDEYWAGPYDIQPRAIDNYYQSASLVLGDVGSLNICRFVRYRMSGDSGGTLFSTLTDQGEYELQQIINVSPDPFPGNYRDIGIQTNFTNEKVIVKFGMNNTADYFKMARFDVFGKARWPTRPNA